MQSCVYLPESKINWVQWDLLLIGVKLFCWVFFIDVCMHIIYTVDCCLLCMFGFLSHAKCENNWLFPNCILKHINNLLCILPLIHIHINRLAAVDHLSPICCFTDYLEENHLGKTAICCLRRVQSPSIKFWNKSITFSISWSACYEEAILLACI